jgi:hypothetical protein
MEKLMGHNDHMEDDGDFNDFLQQLLDGHHLEGAPEGITKLVIDKGLERLSAKQMYVFNTQVLGEHTVKECARCSADIPWSEMHEALDNGGLCGYCWHMSEKIKHE